MRKAFKREGTDGFAWVESMGSIVTPISASDAGLTIPDCDLHRHSLWKNDGNGSPSNVCSFKKRRDPVLPVEWITNGVPALPLYIRYGVINGAVRAIFLSEEASEVETTLTVGLLPDHIFEIIDARVLTRKQNIVQI